MPADLISLIQRNAEELRRLHERIHETLLTRSRSPEDRAVWAAACEEFHRRYNGLAFPGGYDGALDRVLAGDAHTVEAALCFVECRPYFFRSGYMFDAILRKLKHAPMNADQSDRLATVVKAYSDYRERRKKK